MDPDECLRKILEDMRRYNEVADADGVPDEERDAASDVIAGFAALHAWLSNGGFLPAAWSR